MLKNKKGFSLLEILITCVLVFIIGFISMRIHTYHVEKAMVVDAVRIMKNILEAEQVYRMENKRWTFSFDELPIEIGTKVNGSELSNGQLPGQAVRTENFVFMLASTGSSNVYTVPENPSFPNIAVIAKRCYPGEPFDEASYNGYVLYHDMRPDFAKRFHFQKGSYGTHTNKVILQSIYKFLEKRFGQNTTFK